MTTLWQDIRYGARLLSRRPGVTLVALLTLGLGIGATTAVFGFVSSLFLRPLPVESPERVMRLYGVGVETGDATTFSYANYADLRDRCQSFDGLAAHQYTAVSLNAGGGAAEAQGEIVTGNYFAVLGARAALGRTLLPEDDVTPGAHPVAVVGAGAWRRRFGSDPGVVGKKMYINGHPFTVVGVMPDEFRGTYGAFASDFWVPMMMHEQARPRGAELTHRGWGWLHGTGRLKAGATLASAQAELDHHSAWLREEYPDVNQGRGFRLWEAGMLPEQQRAGVSGLLTFFMAVVGLLLVAACANVASLLLSMVTGRRQEIALRQSLGATRGRLLRQLLTESLLLSLLGGAAGLALALWLTDGMLLLVPPDFTNFSPALGLDARVLAFAFGVTLLTGLLCGLFPALRASRADLSRALKEGGGAVSAGRSRLQQSFVVVQVAVSLVLLVASGLLVRSLRESEAFRPGFETEGLLLARFDLDRNGYAEAQGRNFYGQLAERMRSLPGVRGVSYGMVTPLGPDREQRGVRIPGHEREPGQPLFIIDNNVVGPDYFRVMGIPLVSGRGFDERDAAEGARPVVVVNETMARRFWPGTDPVGQTIQLGRRGPEAEIVGVARDIKYYELGEEPQPFFYGSFPQSYAAAMTLHVRADGDPRALFGALRREVERLDPNVAPGLTTFDELRQVALAPGRSMAVAAGAFGLLALLLAAVGMYGVISYAVSRRTREIGIRMALGARAPDIARLVLGQGLAMAAVGVSVGVAAALALTRFLASVLFGVSAADPLTFASVSALLALVALLACYLPARRATKVDPMEALRYE